MTERELIERQVAILADADIKDCCKQADSLRITERLIDRTTFQCSVCGCRHRNYEAEPVFVGATMS